ncbi:NAD(P)-dependent alcohol dehydrogenase [Kribbella deserti]|uniref:NAD(P)-dependent alcohol dehydrogenase n=1 Tax=Kribbella deserti TaxID=1926257 RepID=A0ABV6QXH5_9ACTN
MKAIVQDTYGSTTVLELRDIPKPTPEENEVLLRVRAAGVDAGVWHLMTGLPYLLRLGYGVRRPKHAVRGREVAGSVEAVGSNVTRFQPGDEVFGTCEGSFAQYAVARVDRLSLKPAATTFQQAAALPISGGTALQAVRDSAKVQAGQRVLVIGAAGGVGTYAVQLAKAFGAHVTGVCSTKKLELVQSIGADEVIDYTRDELKGQYDAILDIAGNRPLRQLRRLLTAKGTLVIIGGENGGKWLGGTERLLRAALLSPFIGQRLLGMISSERAKDFDTLANLVEKGEITPVIDSAYPLAEAAQAIDYVQAAKSRGKVTITI